MVMNLNAVHTKIIQPAKNSLKVANLEILAYLLIHFDRLSWRYTFYFDEWLLML